MEDVLSVYSRPYDKDYPVVYMDEKPVQLFANAGQSLKSKDGRIEYEDNEYVRNGTAANRLEIHYTPKHGSGIDMAEIKLSALGRQCISICSLKQGCVSGKHCRCGSGTLIFRTVQIKYIPLPVRIAPYAAMDEIEPS